jgi:ketosteroid isomerase-like protein
LSSTKTNRARVAAIWAAMAKGDGAPFADAMTEDFTWRMMGETAWSGTYSGKTDVRGRMLKALFDQFDTPYRSVASRIHADGDFVVVECQGEVTTKRGLPYNNNYCFVIRMCNGQMIELTEYFDSALVDRALEPPPWA